MDKPLIYEYGAKLHCAEARFDREPHDVHPEAKTQVEFKEIVPVELEAEEPRRWPPARVDMSVPGHDLFIALRDADDIYLSLKVYGKPDADVRRNLKNAIDMLDPAAVEALAAQLLKPPKG